MLNIQENVDIKNYSTFRSGGKFKYFVDISSIDDLVSLYNIIENDEKYKNIKVFPLGGGSNCIFSEGVVNIFAFKINIKGFEIISEDNDFVEIKVGAGEITDEIVNKTILSNFAGMESFSAIPGTIGATPIQNVGAYGSEFKDVITEVYVFDTFDKTLKVLSKDDCQFGYRDSIFKNEAKSRYIVLNINLKLKKIKDNTELLTKREEITNTRWSKLPKPEEIPNVGSFFKNPIVSKKIADHIYIKYLEAKFFPIDENYVKIPAGWLIDQAGLRGKSFGRVGIYDKNALVLINNGGATIEDIENTKNEIVKIIREKFGITLEQEPEVI